MASKTYEIAYKLAAKLDKQYTETFAKAESVARKSMNAIKNTVVKTIAGVGITAFVASSTSALLDFQGSMSEVFTLLPGISSTAMEEMSEQVKKVSIDMGVLPEEVVPALYQSLSAGVPKDNVFNFLETANKVATVGVFDLETAVDGLTTVTNSYGSDVIDATKASDLMFTAVKEGKTTFDEMSKSLFNVLPSASASGVAFGDVTAALAAMTSQGIPTSVATTKLRGAIDELSDTGSKVGGVFEKVSGTSFKAFIAGGGNLQEALQMLEKHANDTNVGINELFNSNDAGSAALALTGKGTEKFTSSLEAMANATGSVQTEFERMDKTIPKRIEQFKAMFQVFKLNVGEFGLSTLVFAMNTFGKVSGSVSKVLEDNGAQVSLLKTNFDSLRTELSKLGNVIFGDVGTGFDSIAQVVIPKVINVLTFFVDKAREVVSFFETNWGSISTIISDVGGLIGDFVGSVSNLAAIIFDSLMPAFEGVGTSIFDNIPSAVDILNDLITTATEIVDYITANWSTIGPIILGVGIAFGTIKLGLLITDLYKCTKALIGNTTAWIAGTKAKIIDKAETLYLMALYGKDMVVSFAKSTAALAKNTAAWIASKVQLVAQKAGLIALKGVQLISTGVTTAMTVAQWALNAAFYASPIGWVVLAIGALIAIGVLLYKNWDTIKLKVIELWDSMSSFITDISAKFPVIGQVIAVVKDYIGAQIANIKQIFSGVIDFIAGVFTGDWSRAWEGIVSAFGGIFAGIGEMVKAPLNVVITLVNSVIDNINAMDISIPDWVPKLGGQTFSLDIPQIPAFAKGTDNSPSTFIAGEAGAELVTNRKHSKVFTALETGAIFRNLSRLENLWKRLGSGGEPEPNGGLNGNNGNSGGGGGFDIAQFKPQGGGTGGSGININYAPNINIDGGGNKDDILATVSKLLAEDSLKLEKLVRKVMQEEKNRKVLLAND